MNFIYFFLYVEMWWWYFQIKSSVVSVIQCSDFISSCQGNESTVLGIETLRQLLTYGEPICTHISGFSHWLSLCSLFWLIFSLWHLPPIGGFKLSCGNESAFRKSSALLRLMSVWAKNADVGLEWEKGQNGSGKFWTKYWNDAHSILFACTFSAVWVFKIFCHELLVLLLLISSTVTAHSAFQISLSYENYSSVPVTESYYKNTKLFWSFPASYCCLANLFSPHITANEKAYSGRGPHANSLTSTRLNLVSFKGWH